MKKINFKTPKDIINHLSPPIKSNYTKYNCLFSLMNVLPDNLQKGIVSLNVKNNILYIFVNHPAYQTSFNYHKNNIKELYKTITYYKPECKNISFNLIKIYTKYTKKNKKISLDEKLTTYKVKDFEIKTTDKELYNIFEKIKENLRKKT